MKEQLYILLNEGEEGQNGDIRYSNRQWLRPVKEQQQKWIPISERKPTEADASKAGEVLWLYSGEGQTRCGSYDFRGSADYWTPLPPVPERTAEEKAFHEFKRWLDKRAAKSTSNLWDYDDVVAAYEFGRKQQEQPPKP